jgi:hypothetical protein
MWIDKTLYWQDDGNKTVYPAPSEKRIEYAEIRHGSIAMQMAIAVYDDASKSEVNQEELAWHRAHGAEITMPNG